MKYTNKLNLPEPLVNALMHDEYNAGHSNYTPSSLLRPAYMQKLEATNEPEQDVSDMVFAMMGKAVHKVIETTGTGNKSFFSEERVYMKFEKWTISMMFDSLFLDAKEGILDDYKSSTVYKFTKDYRGAMREAPDWDFQLNMGAYILRKGGYVTQPIPLSKLAPGEVPYYKIPFHPIHITQIRIIGILKDFYKTKAKRDKLYPQSPIQVRGFSIWSDEKIEKEIRYRANERDLAKKLDLSVVTPCSNEEVWATDDCYALMKKGRKSAVKLFKDTDSLFKFALEKEFASKEDGKAAILDKIYSVEFRPGERKRCESYCSVSKFCPFYAEFKKNADKKG